MIGFLLSKSYLRYNNVLIDVEPDSQVRDVAPGPLVNSSFSPSIKCNSEPLCSLMYSVSKQEIVSFISPPPTPRGDTRNLRGKIDVLI